MCDYIVHVLIQSAKYIMLSLFACRIRGDVKGSNGGFRHWQVSGLAVSIVAACFSSPNVHSVDCALGLGKVSNIVKIPFVC